jgi:membrane protease YdiL (CAAX protease family)
MTVPPVVAPSPFDRLRARGLVLQLLALSAGALALYDRVAPMAKGSMSAHAERVIALLFYAIAVLLLVVRAGFARLEWRRVFGPFPTREQLPLLSVIVPVDLLTLGAVTVYIPLSYIAPGFVERTILSDSALFDVRTVADWLELVVVGVVAAPFVEELFFRGILLHRWARRWGTTTAVVATSALFALLHSEWIGHFLFGVAMAALYLRTRRLWMPIVAHALSNGVLALFALVDVLRHAPPGRTTLAEFRGEWPLGVAMFVSGSALLWWYLKRYWPGGQGRAVLSGDVPYDSTAERGA